MPNLASLEKDERGTFSVCSYDLIDLLECADIACPPLFAYFFRHGRARLRAITLPTVARRIDLGVALTLGTK
jgi:hypothetical protein